MAVIKSAAHIPGTGLMPQGPRTADFLISEAPSSQSREVVQVPQGAVPLFPGSFVQASGAPATTTANITGIVLYATNPVDGPVNQVIIARNAEVRDAYLMYGALDPVATATRLATLGIIVRQAVLPNTRPGGFGMDVPPSGPPVSGIPTATADGEAAPPPPDPNAPPPDPNAPAPAPTR
jgi:hypothetical protein